jgi:hypothetical protein
VFDTPGTRKVVLAAVLGLGLLLAACSSGVAAPKVSGNVPSRLLSRHGPFASYGRPNTLFVDTSLVRLRRTVSGINPSGYSGRSPTCWPDARDEAGVMYVGALLQSDGCVVLTAIHIDLGRPAVLQLWAAGKNGCPIGARSSAPARLVLMGVPLSSLPRDTTLTVQLLDRPGPPISSATTRLA